MVNFRLISTVYFHTSILIPFTTAGVLLFQANLRLSCLGGGPLRLRPIVIDSSNLSSRVSLDKESLFDLPTVLDKFDLGFGLFSFFAPGRGGLYCRKEMIEKK